mmetsp:Transcript_10979/g.18688  ORF Transcript_10979/g.18688 Transcript_10979/m.18688 type:complete len:114 (-) Transcript_10979:106-447(-)
MHKIDYSSSTKKQDIINDLESFGIYPDSELVAKYEAQQKRDAELHTEKLRRDGWIREKPEDYKYDKETIHEQLLRSGQKPPYTEEQESIMDVTLERQGFKKKDKPQKKQKDEL